jgi:hypothetical protein
MDLVERILSKYAAIPYAYDNLESQTVFDRERGRFLWLALGWEGSRRVHSVAVDVELRGNIFWIHRDGTEEGIAADLEESGITKDRIVLAWIPEAQRKFTGYAVG